MLKKKKGNQEIDSLKNQLARALADYDNFTKRVEREREATRLATAGRFISKFLPILDMLWEAQNHLKDEGIALTIKRFEDELAAEGIESINPARGAEFDGELHEAVDTSTEEELKNGQIISTAQRGWKFKDGFVIRHAKVVVNKKEENK